MTTLALRARVAPYIALQELPKHLANLLPFALGSVLAYWETGQLSWTVLLVALVAIFLLTDGRLDEPDKVVATIDRLNADRKTRINTILFVDRVVDEDESTTLKEIAPANGGTFKLVRAADLLK